MKYCLFIALNLFLSFGALAQSGNPEFFKMYGKLNDYIQISDFKRTSDGGYILVGSTKITSSYHDAVIVKLNGAGSYVWASAYQTNQSGGSGNYYDSFRKVVELPTGEFVVLGLDGSTNKYWLAKFNATGTFLVDRHVERNTLYSSSLLAADLGLTNTGNIYVTGTEDGFLTSYDIFLFEFNPTNLYAINPNSVPTLTAPSEQQVFSTIATSDGGYLITGKHRPYGDHGLVLKRSSAGTLQWNVSFDPPTPSSGLLVQTSISSAVELSNGDFIVAGNEYTPVPGTYFANSKVIVSRISSTGVVQWANYLTLDSLGIVSIDVGPGGFVYLMGSGRSVPGAPNKAVMAIINQNGNFLGQLDNSLGLGSIGIADVNSVSWLTSFSTPATTVNGYFGLMHVRADIATLPFSCPFIEATPLVQVSSALPAVGLSSIAISPGSIAILQTPLLTAGPALVTQLPLLPQLVEVPIC